MRVFEIYNPLKRKRKVVARLSYDEHSDIMSIAIADDAQPADLPLMLELFAKRGEREIPDEWARRWVEDRIPPRGRQNLGEILRAHGLDHYDEIELLASANGRSAQDDFLIREVVPSSVNYAVVSLQEGNRPAARTWCAVIGPIIAEKRRNAGLTQKELAEKTGIDQAAISRIESGNANPTLNTLDALVRGVDHFLVVKVV